MKTILTLSSVLLFTTNLNVYERDMVRIAGAELSQAEKRLSSLSEQVKALQKRHKGDSEVVATAYCNDPICINVPDWNDGKTRLGTIADMDTVAVDPKVIPLKSILYIEGVGWRLAEDIGGKIKQNKIDVFMGDIGRARQFGKKKLRIKVYAPKAKG